MEGALQTLVLPTRLFHDVFNASPIGIAVENLEGEPLFVNPAFCSMLGFSEEELLRKHCVDFSPPEDAEKDWALFRQLRTGTIEHYQLDKRYFRRDGSLLWGHLSISLLKSSSSPLVLAMVEDISDKKAGEESRFRHVAIVESSEDAIISKDLAAAITSWNIGAERMFGYKEEEVIGRPITILIPPELSEEENKILERLRAGGRIEHYETKRVTKTGKLVDVSLIIGPIKDSTGRLLGFTKIAHDITQRRMAEESLRELNRTLEGQTKLLQSREELLKSFVKNVPAGVAMLDREMRYLQVSDRWCADYSVESAQILGRSHYDVFPDVPEHWKAVHRRALEGETVRAAEDRWEREDGSTTWVRWEIRPWATSSGAIGGILILAEDITHRKQMEEALSGMSRRVIESQERERTRIARELHDDINQRIAMLAMELDVLRQSLPDLDADVRNRLEKLRHVTEDIGAEIQEIAHSLHSSKLEYLGLVAACKSFCMEVADWHKVEVDFTTDNIPTTVPPEIALCLFRVLQESLNNAVKHSGAQRFEAHLRGMSGDIQLKVRDHGIGFDAAAMMVSRGLGLISMRERVSMVNGTLFIASKPMTGTEITVRVPQQ